MKEKTQARIKRMILFMGFQKSLDMMMPSGNFQESGNRNQPPLTNISQTDVSTLFRTKYLLSCAA